jgi:hypothetical protein
MPKRVRCIDNEGAKHYLKKGEIYEVVKEYEDTGFGTSTRYIVKGCTNIWYADRFEVVEEDSSQPIVIEPPTIAQQGAAPLQPDFDFDKYNRIKK